MHINYMLASTFPNWVRKRAEEWLALGMCPKAASFMEAGSRAEFGMFLPSI
jgi:hypothetical protein